MRFSEDILKAFDLEAEEERDPVNIMQVQEAIIFIKECATRIVRKSEQYMHTLDAEIQMDCIDIVTTKLNDFTQVFKDIMIFIRQDEGTYRGTGSLRYCISSYDTLDFSQTDVEQEFLRALLLRNEITHDYFNRELHQQKLIRLMENCSYGSMDICEHLEEYLKKQGLMEQYINKNVR